MGPRCKPPSPNSPPPGTLPPKETPSPLPPSITLPPLLPLLPLLALPPLSTLPPWSLETTRMDKLGPRLFPTCTKRSPLKPTSTLNPPWTNPHLWPHPLLPLSTLPLLPPLPPFKVDVTTGKAKVFLAEQLFKKL